MTQPAQSSGHEWKPSRVTDCCTCGWHCEPNSTYPECKKQWQAHAASVAQAAQPPYDDRDQSAVSAFEKWWLALASSDDPIVNELDSLNLSQQATVVTFCKRAFAAAQPLEPKPLRYAGTQGTDNWKIVSGRAVVGPSAKIKKQPNRLGTCHGGHGENARLYLGPHVKQADCVDWRPV